jgi:peptide/nickel transport system permease protein
MASYILRRLLLMVPVLFVVTLVLFVVLRILPGDPVTALYGDAGLSNEQKAELRAELGLNKPVTTQYVDWVGDLLRGNLGNSLITHQSTFARFRERLPTTAELTVLAMVISLLISIPAGTISAIHQDTWTDYLARVLSMLALAIPGFWLATLVIVFPAIWWGWSPPLGDHSLFRDPWLNLQQFLPAAAVLGASLAGSVSRFTRAMVLEVLRQDYVRTARSKGLRELMTVRRHVLRNALIPVVTIVGIQFAVLLGGTVIIEQVFSLAGVGSLTFEAISNRDFNQIQTNVLLIATILVISNLLVDLAYAWLNPRIRYA